MRHCEMVAIPGRWPRKMQGGEREREKLVGERPHHHHHQNCHGALGIRRFDIGPSTGTEGSRCVRVTPEASQHATLPSCIAICRALAVDGTWLSSRRPPGARLEQTFTELANGKSYFDEQWFLLALWNKPHSGELLATGCCPCALQCRVQGFHDSNPTRNDCSYEVNRSRTIIAAMVTVR